MPGISNALGPKFQTVLASAWISKRSASKYIQDYIAKIKAAQSSKDPTTTTAETTPFAPPIQVQVLDLDTTAQNYTSLYAVDGGEDSLFHARNAQNICFGVADGVGGWNESGIDPSVFSRTLTAYAADSVERAFVLHEASDTISPRDVLRDAFARMRHDNVPAYGSSTALVMSLSNASGTLSTAQLGDSTYVVLDGSGKSKVVSAEQQHKFNMPYQLTIPPVDGSASKGAQKRKEEGVAQYYFPQDRSSDAAVSDDFSDLVAVGFDTPLDARVDEHALAHNDVVVAATDGMFDNVHVDEVERLAERFTHAMAKLGAGSAALDVFGGLAYSLVAQAVANYVQSDISSPFAERARLAGYSYTGGKPDDVSVVVAWVRERERVQREMKPKL